MPGSPALKRDTGGAARRAPAQVDIFKPAADPIKVLIVVPTLDTGAADSGAVELVRILCRAGHHAVVVSRAGRRVADVLSAGGEFIALNVASHNPAVMLRNAVILARLARDRHCDVIHALGRAGAWSAYFAARMRGTPFLTSWYKGFREQNFFKRFYNGVMARGDRVIAVSEQLAQLVNDRYATPWDKIAVVPCSIDSGRFDPAKVPDDRIDEVRRDWGVGPDTRVILIAGRILRRKGHDVVVRAARRLKESGFNDFLFVFVGEDRGHSHYTGELWDLVLATGTMDVVRMAGPVNDMSAVYAASYAVISAAIQPEGVQRVLLEAQAMTRPVLVSDLAAGADVVLTAPAVPENKATGVRFAHGDDAALVAAIGRLFAMSVAERTAMGARGRSWVLEHFNLRAVSEQTLRLYAEISGRPQTLALVPGVEKIRAI